MHLLPAIRWHSKSLCRNAKHLTRREALDEEGLPAEDAPASGEGHSAQPEALLDVKQQQQQQLWHFIRQLPLKYRTPLILFDIEGFSYEEVSSIEKVPLGTVRSRILRARQQLRHLLEKNGAIS
jgi:RNA polymerase sigma factor (sigma-70 family)